MTKKLIAAILCSLSIAFLAAQYGGDKSNTIPASGATSFSLVSGQGATAFNSSFVTTLTVTLPNNPTVSASNVVVAAIQFDSSATPTGVALVDTATIPNTYTPSASSPCVRSGLPRIYTFYLVSPPSGATKTLVFTWTGADDVVAWASEFKKSSGSVSYDTDVCASNTFAGTTVNLPSITAAGVNGMIFSSALPTNSITNPGAGVTQGGCTGNIGGVDTATTGGGSEYCLNVTGSTVPNFTDGGTGDLVAVLNVAFK